MQIHPKQDCKFELSWKLWSFIWKLIKFFSHLWKIRTFDIKHRCREGRNIGNSPPPRHTHTHTRNRKSCWKMMLFPTAPFRATTFPKLVKNSIFLLNVNQTFSSFSKFPNNLCFHPNTRKINAGFVNLFETYAKVRDFRNFLNNFFEKFRKFLKNFPTKLCFSSKRAKI